MMYDHIQLITAIITPFTEADTIDYPALDQLTDRLLAEGSQGFVVGGTTGESPTLTHDEKLALYTHMAKYVGERGIIIANVGDNNTAHSVELAQEVGQISGVDSILAVTPYYNKPSQAGMIAHYTAIADASPVPVMLYNIPGRSAAGLTVETIVALAQHPNINAVKQVTSIDDLGALVEQTPADFAVYTGEDAQTLAAYTIGANGTISVSAHLYGKQMQELFTAVDTGDIKKAGALQRWLTPRMNALFMYPSPSPVKAILAEQHAIKEQLRLPLIPLTADELATLHGKLDEE